jgi:Rho-binding antiterminator
MNREYRPISCVQHERLEFSVLRKYYLDIEYLQRDERIKERVMPLDVTTRDGAEWLKFRRENGDDAELRLDTILDFKEFRKD